MTSNALTENHREELLSPADKEVLREAKDAAACAYAPYSSFYVGAAIRTEKGNTYSAANVENVSFPIGTCAERNAIAAAVRGEGPEMEINTIAIAAQKPPGNWVSVSPCGACRQAICEFGRNAKVIFVDAKGNLRTEGIRDLLPESFSF